MFMCTLDMITYHRSAAKQPSLLSPSQSHTLNLCIYCVTKLHHISDEYLQFDDLCGKCTKSNEQCDHMNNVVIYDGSQSKEYILKECDIS